MNLDQIIGALRARCPTFQGRVAGAAQWAGLTEDENPSLPAVYVVPLREDAGPNESEVSYFQTITNTFGVILLVPNFADERGQDASRWIELLKHEVFRALLSWTMEPRDEHSEIVYDGGALIYMDDARAAYQLDFAFETYLDIFDSWQGANSMRCRLTKVRTLMSTASNLRCIRTDLTVNLKEESRWIYDGVFQH